MTDILVMILSKEKLSGNEVIKGIEHFHTKKAFLATVGKIWDTVKENPEIKVSLQLTNLESDC